MANLTASCKDPEEQCMKIFRSLWRDNGVLDTRVGTGAGGMDIAVKIPGTWMTGAFKAGDVLIFSDTTLHKALPNKGNEIRQSFDARYQPASAQ